MPRLARTILPNLPYHVTQRGNRRGDVFFAPKHYRHYLEYLAQYSTRFKFDILAWCLMTNHIHIVGIPRKSDSLSRTIQSTHSRHTQVVNRIMGLNGHMWQSRFYSTALDDFHLWCAIRYVEQNPVRAGIVVNAQDYTWSSAGYHCGIRTDPVVTHDSRIDGMFVDWSKILREVPGSEIIEKIRRRTQSGIPCGDDGFMKMISRKTGLDFVDRPRGRPCKPHE